MAAISFSIARGAGIQTVAAGSQSVTAATNAPAAGDVEIRLSSAALAAGLTQREVRELAEIIIAFIMDPVQNANVFPNL